VRRCAKLITPLEADNEGLREPQLLRWHCSCLIAWLIYEIWYTTYRNAAVYDLQLDSAVDIAVLIVIMLMVGGMINAGELRWFILVPTIGQIIDVFQSVVLGINDAAEKSYVPSKGST
jgi:hypothetical protein